MNSPSPTLLTRERIHEVLWDLTAKHTGKDREQLRPADRLIQDLGADSLGVVELSMELEEALGITLPEGVLENPQATLGEIEKTLCDHLLGKN
jgi:acyl carrier protein